MIAVKSKVRVRDVLTATAEVMDVPVEDILSDRRYVPRAEARLLVYYVAATQFGWSHHVIARVLSRDRSTVSDGVRSTRAKMTRGKVNPAAVALIEQAAHIHADRYFLAVTSATKQMGAAA